MHKEKPRQCNVAEARQSAALTAIPHIPLTFI